MHSDDHSPAVAVTKMKMAAFLVENEKAQLAQGFYYVFRMHFPARHTRYAGTATRAVVMNPAAIGSLGNDCFSLRSDSR